MNTNIHFQSSSYRLEKKQEQVKYAEIILDFSYFKISEVQDRKIEDDPVSR